MAMIHEGLYNEDGLHKIQFNNFIERIVSDIDLIQDKRDLKLQYHLEIEEVILNVNQAIPLSVILSELLNNVYKHAYPNQEYGNVTIYISLGDADNVTLEVRDSGIGYIEEKFQRVDRMGFRMVEQLTSQLGGTFEIESESAHSGTVGRVKFKRSDIAGSSQSKRINMATG